ncbi:MAG TPA: preprotein translocase subunit YajC [Pseudonocardiaceae bacterium]
MSNLLLPALIVLMIGMLYFATRKQKRAAQQQQQMQSGLSEGDRVMTTSGLYGTVVDTSDDTIDIEIADGIVTTWLRAAVKDKVAQTVQDDVVDDIDEDTDTVDADETVDSELNSEVPNSNGVKRTNGYQPASSAELAPPLDKH